MSHGFTVLVASSAAEALALFDRAVPPVRLVLSDVTMPDMDGPTLVERIRERAPATPALLMSAYAAAPFDSTIPFLAKPFTAEMLLAKIAMLTGPRGR